jgi:hypothetical protein
MAVTSQDFALREQSEEINHLLFSLGAQSEIATENIRIGGARKGKDAEIEIAKGDKRLYGTQGYASDRRTEGALTAADIMARAKITNRLTHMIAQAPSEG